jgi:hypothetical protein
VLERNCSEPACYRCDCEQHANRDRPQYKEIDGASKQLYGLLGWAQGNGHWSTAWIAK